jgi:hypothetical protein
MSIKLIGFQAAGSVNLHAVPARIAFRQAWVAQKASPGPNRIADEKYFGSRVLPVIA